MARAQTDGPPLTTSTSSNLHKINCSSKSLRICMDRHVTWMEGFFNSLLIYVIDNLNTPDPGVHLIIPHLTDVAASMDGTRSLFWMANPP